VAAEDRLVSAEEWFSGGERLPYDPERARFDDSSALRVFVRHASGEAMTLTFLPGWPDGSFGWAKVDALLAERSDAGRLFLDYVGHGDSDKPLDHPYSTFERADLVEALWRARSVEAPSSLPSTTRASSASSCLQGGSSGSERARLPER
jgi:pimeloyl-ACP methyl ester carboxylesterase